MNENANDQLVSDNPVNAELVVAIWAGVRNVLACIGTEWYKTASQESTKIKKEFSKRTVYLKN